MSTRFGTSDLLEFNIQQYLDREFVNNNFYFNVPSGFVSVDGSRGDVLRRVNGNRYESFTDKWVEGTDMTGDSSAPVIDPSGVWIDGAFHAQGAAPYKPAFNFAEGAVVFEGTAVPDTSIVVAEFSYKDINVDFPDSNSVTLVFSQIRDNVDFTQHVFPSGNQRALPLVVVDLQTSFDSPGALGGAKNINQLVTLHVVASDRHKLNAITDFLQHGQFRKTVNGINYNVTPELFTVNGDRANTYLDFTDMQTSGSLLWRKFYIDQARVMEKEQFFNVFRSRVDWTVNMLFVNPNDT
jgi:hypothetical protein